MSLNTLRIKNFRNIKDFRVELDPGFNIFIGKNGSGKTSILEAIYISFRKKSFRTNKIENCINLQENFYSTFIQTQEDDYVVSQKQVNKNSLVKVNDNLANSKELAFLVPVQIINNNIFNVLDSGSKYRRKIIDWGLFYSEPSFIDIWAKYNKALKNKNAALKSNQGTNDIQAWNSILAKTGFSIHSQRKKYLNELSKTLQTIIQKDKKNISMQLTDSWESEAVLEKEITQSLKKDMYYRVSQVGPHKTDILFSQDNMEIKNIYSRGQQKTFLLNLYLSQSINLFENYGKKCLFLIDDINSELDHENLSFLINTLVNINAQTLITSINDDTLSYFNNLNHRVFHVEREMINNSI
jgi:DNA replication and repair protein RecF